ncbi:putative calcium-binding protein CML17 [Zostera marina]|uniref:Putative calcium-binding protein CML17 n=1 Tax=Zostera marina TaxID=29655 RepID=A0A0K9Q3Z9_ZOSMR|nr:putative calcium-binding protein CML17 [Zostera marina]
MSSGSLKNGDGQQKEEIFQLWEMFRSFDKDKDGSLTHMELTSLICSFGIKPTKGQLKYFLEKTDSDQNGRVRFKDLVSVVAPNYNGTQPYTEYQLWRLFHRVFDRDEDGVVSDEDLMYTMEMLGHKLSKEEINDLMEEADTDGDGVINFQEFSVAMISAAFQSTIWGIN